MISDEKLRLGVLASHGGTNLQALVDACKLNELNAEVCVIISNNSQSMALQRAKNESIPNYHLSGSTHPKPKQLDAAIRDSLKRHNVDIVILAGYMKMLGPRTISHYRQRVLNSHPALLPKYGGKGMYGTRVHKEVLKAGEAYTGITIHLVDRKYDHGPKVARFKVRVHDDDTVESLEERVKAKEHAFWVRTLQRRVKAKEPAFSVRILRKRFRLGSEKWRLRLLDGRYEAHKRHMPILQFKRALRSRHPFRRLKLQKTINLRPQAGQTTSEKSIYWNR
jgi:phosphoribosylglycinamide formyltransferase-1